VYIVFRVYNAPENEIMNPNRYLVLASIASLLLLGRATSSATEANGLKSGQVLSEFASQEVNDSTHLAVFSIDSIRDMSRGFSPADSAADAVVLLDRHQEIFHPDLTRLRRIHRLVEIQTPDGAREFLRSEYTFNSWTEIPHLITARIIYPDNTIGVVSPDSVYIHGEENAMTSASRKMIWEFPEIKTGCILETIAQFEGSYDDPLDLYYLYLANEYHPVAHFDVELIVPSGWHINESHSEKMKHTVDSGGNETTYHWSCRDMPSLIKETSAPDVYEQSQWVHFGTAKTWPETVSRYWLRIEDRVDTGQAMVRIARRLTRYAQNRQDKIDAVFRYVSRDIRYVAIAFGENTFIPRSPMDVELHRYGDCKDKTMFLVSLLRCLDIKAYPALISSNDPVRFAPEVPDIAQFNHMIAYLPDDGQFVDPSCTVCGPYDLSVSYLGHPVLIIDPHMSNPLRDTRTAIADDNYYKRTSYIIPRTQGGVDILEDIVFGGEVSLILKNFLDTSDSATIHDFILGRSGIGLWRLAALQNYQIYHTYDFEMLYSWGANFASDSLFMTNVAFERSGVWFYSLANMLDMPDTVGRRLDFVLNAPFRVEENYITIPGPDWQLYRSQPSWDIGTPWYSATCSTTVWPDSLSVRVVFNMETTRIAVADLSAFVRSLHDLELRVEDQSPIYRRVDKSSPTE